MVVKKMFYLSQDDSNRNKYIEMLQILGSLSRLFSDNPVPYLYYRAAENIFCHAFDALNVSRGDISVDATSARIGIGLKTFLHGKGETFQKIAEFNKAFDKLDISSPKSLIVAVSRLRNERVEFTMRAHNLEHCIYHLVTRKNDRFEIYEEPMDSINLSALHITKNTKHSVYFTDGKNEYNYYIPKSTLFKRFRTTNALDTIQVKIIDDPLSFLSHQTNSNPHWLREVESNLQQIYLPLYSPRTGLVQPSSGLNQWNAGGRPRDVNEMYISVPLWIHRKFPGFFPYQLGSEEAGEYGEPFSLVLPDGVVLSAKICQQNGKALMSNPNRLLGKWLLRQVFQLPNLTVLTYNHLVNAGIDSVKITKINEYKFKIEFASLGSYKEFAELYE
jgi:hypothetical protein